MGRARLRFRRRRVLYGFQTPAPRRAYSIAWREAASLPLPLGTDHAHAIPRFGCGFFFSRRRRAFVSQDARAKEVSTISFSTISSRFARALTRSVFSPPFPSPQLKKQNDKESARDMTGYKPSNFDKGFRDGKGWGDLVRRAASPRFPPSRRNAFDESAKLSSRTRAFSRRVLPTRLAAGRCEDQSTPLDLHVRIIPRRAATTARRGR